MDCGFDDFVYPAYNSRTFDCVAESLFAATNTIGLHMMSPAAAAAVAAVVVVVAVDVAAAVDDDDGRHSYGC